MRADLNRWRTVLQEAISDGNMDQDAPLGDHIFQGWQQIMVGVEQIRDELIAMGLGKGDPTTVVDEARIAAVLLLALADLVEEEHTL